MHCILPYLEDGASNFLRYVGCYLPHYTVELPTVNDYCGNLKSGLL